MRYPIGSVADLATIEMGQSPKGDTVQRAPMGLPLLNGPTEFGQQHPVPAQWTDAGVRFARAGDVLFCVRGSTTGRMNRADQDYAIGRGIAALRARDGVDSRIVKYALDASLADLLAGVSGSVFPNLSREQILRHQVPVPPRTEQQAIVEVLGALDDKIAANTALATATDAYLATLLDELAADVGTKSLGSIADVNRRSVKPQPGGEIRYVDIAAVGEGRFDYPPATPWSNAPGRARRGMSSGDTVWSTVRPNRRSHALNLEDDPLLVASTGLAVLSPREVGFAYLYEATRRPEFTAYLENVAEGSAYPAVRADRFVNAPVPDLSADLVAHFESEAAPIRRLNAMQARESRTLAATRDALLPQLMSGKLRVRDAENIASEAGA